MRGRFPEGLSCIMFNMRAYKCVCMFICIGTCIRCGNTFICSASLLYKGNAVSSKIGILIYLWVEFQMLFQYFFWHVP